jgi:inner membrane protein
MDTITHTLTGAVIGYAGFQQRGGRAALWTAIAASEFPDVDIVMAWGGSETYLHYHRSFTHSVLLLPFWAALVAGMFWALAGRRDFRLLYTVSAVSIALHLVLDLITNYGTVLLWPVSDGRFAQSWVFIVDVYVWAVLLAGLIACLATQRAAVARVTLGVVAAYFLFCGASRAVALQRARASASRAARLDAFPQPMNPLSWTIIRDDGPVLHWIARGRNDSFVQFRDQKLLPEAEATPAVKLFRWFAAFPLVEKREANGLTVLRYRDLRFRTMFPNGRVSEGMFMTARVVFNREGNVLKSVLTGEAEDRR